jgi:hypothetical protein
MATPAPIPGGVLPAWSKTPFAGQYVNSVATSADGSINVAGTYFLGYGPSSSQGSTPPPPFTVGILAWDANGNQLWENDIKNVTEGVYWVAVSRDGSTAAGGGLISTGNGFVYAYDAKGNSLLSASVKARTNMVALSANGKYLVAAADQLYLYTNKGSGFGAPSILSLSFTNSPDDYVVAAGISSDGSTIVASTASGFVVLVPNNNGTLGTPSYWQVPNGSIHWAAISADGSAFAAAGTVKNQMSDADIGMVFYFKTADFPASQEPNWSMPLPACQNCRCVAIRDDGEVVTAVGSLATPTETATGGLFLFEDNNGEPLQAWTQPTVRAPNSTSLDSAGNYVTAADGYPDASPGKPSPGYFYLYDSAGNLKWSYQTNNMSWPMQITANANAVFAGSDDSSVYYFTAGLSGK